MSIPRITEIIEPGQKAKAGSIPVVLPSDQTVGISGAVTNTVLTGATGQQLASASLSTVQTKQYLGLGGVTDVPDANTPAQLTSTSTPCIAVLLYNPNVSNIYVAQNSAPTSNDVPLRPGDSRVIPCTNANLVYCKVLVNGHDINWQPICLLTA